MKKSIALLLAIVIGSLLSAATAAACPEPVFSYALQNWLRDPYEVTVYHRGELDAGDRETVEILTSAAARGPEQANIRVRLVSLDGDTPAGETARDVAAATSFPWLVIRYPEVFERGAVMWAGALAREQAVRLVNSPLRRTVQERLLAGDCGAWILLRSGDRGADQAAEKLLRETLARLEQTLQLPDPTTWGDWETAAEQAGDDTPKAPRVAFSLVTLDRDNPEEEMLVSMLMGSEPDLREMAGQPMAFPVFGRGRALYALVGRGINEWTITRAAEFLTAPCSCQVKALNPGTDLVTALDWESRVERRPAALPPATGLATFTERAREAEAALEEEGP